MNLDVGGLAVRAAEHLVNHDARVGQGKALALFAGGQKERAHGGGLPQADGRDRALHVLHRVVDGHAGRHRASRRIDVEIDVLVRVLALQKEQLRGDDVGHVVVNRRSEEDDAILQQARIDVVAALAALGLLDDVGHRDVAHGAWDLS